MKQTAACKINRFTETPSFSSKPITRFSPPKLDILNQTEIKVKVIRGTEAERLFGEADFCASWQKLYEGCAWATLMQTPAFNRVWHNVYRTFYEPVFVTGYSETKELFGLLVLAIEKSSGKLVQAGGYHAEYQTWLTTAENNDLFIVNALEKLAEEFPNDRLPFLFLAPHTPLDWLKNSRFTSLHDLRSFPRPLVEIGDGSETAKSLRKKGNKSKVRQMRKFGEVVLSEIKDAEELAKCFDDFEIFGIVRRGAIHNNFTPSDNLKKTFLLELFKNTDFIYPTVLKIGESIASVQLNFRNRGDCMFGTIAHSPIWGSFSPNKFHIYYLCLKLAEDRFGWLDLTPGKDEYKSRHASHIEEAFALTFFFNRADFRKYCLKQKLSEFGKTLLGKVGIERKTFEERLHLLKHKLHLTKIGKIPVNLLKTVSRKISATDEMRIYALEKSQIAEIPKPNLMAENNFNDVFGYEPCEAWQLPKNLFLREALHRVESDLKIYTYAENGVLLHYGWLIPKQEKSFISEVETWFYPLPNSATLFDYYSHPKARGRGLYQNSLRQMIHAAFENPETERVYIGVLANNAPSRHAIEKIGFQYRFSFSREIKFGRKTFRTNAPEEVTKPREA